MARSKAKFVAVEHGGHWLPGPRALAGRDLVVLAQRADETASAFARRFVRQVASANAGGFEIASAALVVSPGFDISRLEARCAIARTLIRSFPSSPGNELLLMAGAEHAAECRPHLLALAEILREGAQTGCAVHVRCERAHGDTPAALVTSGPPSPVRVRARISRPDNRRPALTL